MKVKSKMVKKKMTKSAAARPKAAKQPARAKKRKKAESPKMLTRPEALALDGQKNLLFVDSEQWRHVCYKMYNRPDYAEIVSQSVSSVDDCSAVINLMSAHEAVVSALSSCSLRTNQRKKLQDFVLGDGELNIDSLLDFSCNSVRKLSFVTNAAYGSAKDQNSLRYNFEIKLAGRWYPVKLNFEYYVSMFGPVLSFSTDVFLAVNAEKVNVRYRIDESMFMNDLGENITRSARECFERAGLRPLTERDQNDSTLKNLRAKEMSTNIGMQVSVTGPGLMKPKGFMAWFGPSIEEVKFGTDTAPRRAVIEPELELNDVDDCETDDNQTTVLPFVRVFSIDLKKYMYVDVDLLHQTQHDADALNKLVLPDNVRTLVQGLFSSHVSDMFGDMLSFKHGGMIICAAGPTGVGKTMTAECFAEHTKRPLYPIELGELGTQLDQMEDRLQTIFSRARRWNAVLLLDEADVIFQKRDADLERSAIVGVFLRLLDYYSGFLFLTTNRLDTLDPAFESRITLTIKYPDLTDDARSRIWTNMLKAAGLPVTFAQRLAKWPLNGRRIRSMVRLARMIHGVDVTWDQMETLMNTTVGTIQELLSNTNHNTSGRAILGQFN